MNATEPTQATAADAPPSSTIRPVPAKAAAAKLELLDGGEIIELSIKPSMWLVPIVSFQFVLIVTLAAGVLVVAGGGELRGASFLAFQVLACLAALRVGLAAMQWTSKLYVLTNRRVLRFRGVLGVDLAECSLSRIARLELHASPAQRFFGLGTIVITPAAEDARPFEWEYVAGAADVHERLLRAIQRASGRG
ncbi:MAG: PH domain-containing protein [Phycisphaerales bacterium]|nr:PH domain-containing protein [Phycisphaerales bacterium]